jgi:Ca-activated chloride channel family protein
MRLAKPLCRPLGLLLCLALTAGWIVPAGLAQSAVDDVHVKPRVDPDKQPKEVDLMDPAMKTHTKPFKVDVNLVLVPVTITDPMNRLVTGLDRENFELYEGKTSRKSSTSPVRMRRCRWG